MHVTPILSLAHYVNLGSGKRCQIEALYTYTGKTSCDGWRGISLEECQVKCDKNEVHNFSYPMIPNSYFFSSLRMFLFLSYFYIFISWIFLYFVTSLDFFIKIACVPHDIIDHIISLTTILFYFLQVVTLAIDNSVFSSI